MSTTRLEAFVLLLSLCVVAVSAAPTESSAADKTPVMNATGNTSTTTTKPQSTTVANTSVTPTTVALTTQPMKEEKGLDDDDKGADPKEEGTAEARETKPTKPPRVSLLLYQIELGIRNLTLKDIEFVLDMQKDEEVVSLALGDKLGYLKNGNDNDPHLKVIEDHKDQLVSELKRKREEIVNSSKVPLPPTPPPPPVITTAGSRERLMEYNIVQKIYLLSIDKIEELLSFEDDTLPYAVGDALGYGQDTDYLDYLEGQGAEKWTDILLKTVERKIKYNRDHPPTDPPREVASNDREEVPNRQQQQYVDSNESPLGDGRGGGLDEVEKLANNEFDSSDEAGKWSEQENSDFQGPEEEDFPFPGEGFGQLPEEESQNNVEVDTPGNTVQTTEGTEGSLFTVTVTEVTNEGGNSDDGLFNSDGNDKDGVKESGGSSFVDEEEPGDFEETGSSFGTWHFLTIFIFIGVAVVVGYVCVHNRKKLREGVGAYISDANKRRRRGREYKPLMNT